MTRMFLTTALIASLAAPAFAADKPAEKTFTRDGKTYVYTSVAQADRVVLSGHRLPDGIPFELVVRGDQVTGVSGGEPVSFTYRHAQAKLTAPQVAAR